MRTSIPSLIIGDVVQVQGFTGKVLNLVKFEDCTQVHLSFIEGDKFNFSYLSGMGANDYATIQGNHLSSVTLITVNFESE